MLRFEQRFGARRQRTLYSFSHRLQAFNHIPVHMKTIGNPYRIGEALAEPGVVGRGQIHHDRIGRKLPEIRMLRGIGPQIIQLTAREHLQHRFATQIVNARIVGMSFLN